MVSVLPHRAIVPGVGLFWWQWFVWCLGESIDGHESSESGILDRFSRIAHFMGTCKILKGKTQRASSKGQPEEQEAVVRTRVSGVSGG